MSASDRDISDELTDLEMKMLKAVDLAWEDWEEKGGPLPSSLVTLMVQTHTSLMRRAAKLGKDDSIEWGPPEVALLRLEKVQTMLRKKIEQRARAKGAPHTLD